MIEVLAHAADAARIGVDRPGLQAPELQVFEMGLVASIAVQTDRVTAGFTCLRASADRQRHASAPCPLDSYAP